MGLKRAQSSSSETSSAGELLDAQPSKKMKKADKISKKEKKQRKKEKKKAKKMKKKAKKLKKLRRKLKENGDDDFSLSSSSSSGEEKGVAPSANKEIESKVDRKGDRKLVPIAPEAAGGKEQPVVEESREKSGLKLFGELFAAGKPDSLLKWDYPLRDETRRCFVGLLQTNLPQPTLDRLYATIRDGTCWDQPKRPQSGELLPRKTDWMVAERCLCRYRYGGVEVDPSEFPSWMEDVMELCMPLCGLRGRTRWPNCCNLNLYEDGGMTVGWHADDEEIFQGKSSDCSIISLSLGQTRTFEIKVIDPSDGDFGIRRFELRSGDLLTMEGLMQKHYHHRVPREKSQGPRINLTWRWIKKHQARCPLSR